MLRGVEECVARHGKRGVGKALLPLDSFASMY